jgi:Bacterial TSP3 repeat
MKRLLIAVVGLSLGLVGLNGSVLAQTHSGLVVMDDASGTDGTSGNCNVSGPLRDRTVTCTDLRPGRGVTLIDPGTETAPVAKDVPPTSAPPPDAASAPETNDTTVASATDQDADNEPDELEPGLGLDPTNADTDGDHVADGDELNIYSTDPTVADTDGDGALDGEELFATHTDPLVWDDFSAQDAGSTTEAP